MKRVALAFLMLAGCGTNLHWCITSPLKGDCVECESINGLYYCSKCTDGSRRMAMSDFVAKQVPKAEACQ